MAQRKSPPRTPPKPGAGRKPGTAAARGGLPAGRAPAKKKPGRSIVNQRQTPWGAIVTTVLLVLFAGGIVTYVVATHKTKPAANAGCSALVGKELKCAADIQGLTFKAEPNRNHAPGVVQYDSTPPVGGNHSAILADCTGTVYSQPIANENAVHALEHGAVWITYKPGLSPSDVTTLAALVNGHDHTLMSAYPGQSSPISIQSWGYQLQLDSATDPRLQRFITVLRTNPKTTPEFGASCSDPAFLQHLSTPGHPFEG
jgi:hypothetical protein